MRLRQGEPYRLPECPCETCRKRSKDLGSCSQRIGGQQWPGCVAWMVWFRRCWQMARGEAPETGREPSGVHPEWHILGDALGAVKGGEIVTMDGQRHDIGK